MSDQTQPDPTAPANEQGSVDFSARLASLSGPRTGVTSIWQRREAAASESPAAVVVPEGAPTPVPAAPRATPTPAPVRAAPAPAPATGSSIGRLTRITAADLWADPSAMTSWIAANGESVSELTGMEGLRFQTPSGGTVLGTAADGGAICVVCEVGPSSDEGLGALLRTAAVQQDGTIVWLNGGPSDSHIAALSWLNRATPPRFFLARATGVRIDGSASAPMFELLVRPPRAAETAPEPAAPRRRVEDHVPEG